MKKKVSLKRALCLTAFVGGAIAGMSGTVVGIGGLIAVIALCGLVQIVLSELKIKRNIIIKMNAHKLIDHEMAGLRFLGSQVTVLASRRVDHPKQPGPLQYEQLCKTARGTMFKFAFETMNGSGVARHLEISPISVEEAECWLERDRVELLHQQGRLELA